MKTEIIGLGVGLLASAGYIALQAVDKRRRSRLAKPGQLHLPFSPLATLVRLVLVAAVALAVVRFLPEAAGWFAGAFIVVYTVYLIGELRGQLARGPK